MKPLPPAILLMGPTASGKTALAFEIADRFPVEIISVDSAQVFRDMAIGTAKPDAATLARYPHRLIDLISPEQSYSAARFRADALAAMAEITAAGRVPLLVGGTMLYFKALREGLADLPDADPAMRARIDAKAAERGWPALHAELAQLDAETAARLAPNDAQRIQRALEIVRATGRPLGEHFAAQRAEPLPYRQLSLALLPSDRAVLHERIAQRFDDMLRDGLVAEVAMLRAKYKLNAGLPSMRCVGYRQVWDMLEGMLPPNELRDRGIFATRQFAKRQITWLRAMMDLVTLDPLDSSATEQALKRVAEFLTAA
ncbi:MAG: tRNA (adenosine(37)-N6)-dimethylallyltransferase MiaA [Rhodocyclaceae bacterium]|jgi:tRNA dimethylallyltransferase|nr:tRNA (adenosine(37)-N6)-dimethylallyltransferase MiaA [Rhodocyclaceae bacterium]MBK6553963.1 tRNA (adenosine(37)-N6)-dimethylallyltransferase MiaA [Rhodocyclaceae bacterium]MBK9310759.1 tRNA (adenosine(37)-N6)-dimethylallyltransferase MiaA [Rhodocyclaceae bacterium]MBK9954172.1 tRNA (adenosine(37)-N6)-dimethylallyltransferase MiaA [Rhodocyclaceae bacterium]